MKYRGLIISKIRKWTSHCCTSVQNLRGLSIYILRIHHGKMEKQHPFCIPMCFSIPSLPFFCYVCKLPYKRINKIPRQRPPISICLSLVPLNFPIWTYPQVKRLLPYIQNETNYPSVALNFPTRSDSRSIPPRTNTCINSIVPHLTRQFDKWWLYFSRPLSLTWCKWLSGQ